MYSVTCFPTQCLFVSVSVRLCLCPYVTLVYSLKTNIKDIFKTFSYSLSHNVTLLNGNIPTDGSFLGCVEELRVLRAVYNSYRARLFTAVSHQCPPHYRALTAFHVHQVKTPMATLTQEVNRNAVADSRSESAECARHITVA